MASRLPTLVAGGLALLTAGTASVLAQETSPRHRHGARAHTLVAAGPASATPYRGLTINRAPVVRPGVDADDDVYQDGPVRYNDIRDFSPAPYTTSGVQFPYGLDGIGGYGSDFDYGAGEDSALLDRGAGTGP